MSELPEVETARRGLNGRFARDRLGDLEIVRPGLLQNLREEQLREKTIGQMLQSVGRRAKYLIFYLANGYVFLIHLGMEGRFLVDREMVLNLQAVFHFEDRGKIHLDDIYNHSRLYLARSEAVEELPIIAKLGVEPLTEGYTFERFSALLASRQEIKRLLLDQTKIAGLGNIYANEILYLCGIHPERAANSLTAEAARCLFQEIPKLLERAIAAGGSSTYLYRHIDGSQGRFQEEHRVYQRAGRPCERCTTKIEEIDQGGRPSYFCPVCQPSDRMRMDPLFP
ncbi:MAG: bifunctional DNA-formamidopyrimidine glycosylase/DNA-(apurinic or apyrimidinic site) lyase [Candidatus Bipolaricaulia bacterium]